MHIISYLGLLVLFITVAKGEEDKLQERANNYIDYFIETATNGSGGFIDPLPLDDLVKSFEHEIGFVKFNGEAKLYNGKIFGLSSLKRKGDVVVIDLDDLQIMSTKLTFGKIHATYKGSVTLNNVGPSFTMNVKIAKSEVSMFIMVPAEGGNSTLMSFNIHKLSDMRVSIWGLGAMGWSASMISSLALNALEKQVAKVASLKIYEYFSKELEQVPYPGDSSSAETY